MMQPFLYTNISLVMEMAVIWINIRCISCQIKSDIIRIANWSQSLGNYRESHLPLIELTFLRVKHFVSTTQMEMSCNSKRWLRRLLVVAPMAKPCSKRVRNNELCILLAWMRCRQKTVRVGITPTCIQDHHDV